MFDVLGIGCVAIDDLLFVPRFPAPDEKVRVPRVERHFGGLTGTALVVAARLGAKCAFGGLLGTMDPLSRAVEQNFLAEGIDVSPAVRRADARPIHAMIVVGEEGHTRNIFFHVGGLSGAPDEGVAEDLLRRTRVLFVDHQGLAGAVRAITAAAAAGVEVVADVEHGDGPLTERFVAGVGHLVVPEEFALRMTGADNAEAAVSQLWSERRRAIVVTCGEHGCWWAEARDGRAGPVAHQPAFPVEVVDTTGCGDVFHGAYAAALAQGRPMEERVRLASAAAAMKARQPGGQMGIPRRREVEEFLRQQGDLFNGDEGQSSRTFG